MNIWIYNHYAGTHKSSGSTRHIDLSRQLIKKGHAVTIVASSFHFRRHEDPVNYVDGFVKEEYVDGVKFVWVKTFPYSKSNWKRFVNMIDFAFKIRKIRMQKALQPDIIIGSSVHIFTAFSSYFVARKLKVPFIFEVRDLWPETLIQLGWSKWHPLIFSLSYLEKFLYRRADHIITLLPGINGYFKEKNIKIKEEKVTWIPNSVDLVEFDKKKILHPEEKLVNKSLKILNTGSLGLVYSLDILLKAAKILQDTGYNFHFYFYGNGTEEKKLKDLKDSLNLLNVTFRDSIPKDEIPSLLSEADILFASIINSPLYRYGISLNKLPEYLAAEKPIIFFGSAYNNPIKESGAGITIESGLVTDVVNGLITISEMSYLERIKMAKKGRDEAEAVYDIIKHGGQLELLLNEIIHLNN